jgi:hypothetical protein
MFVPVSQLIFFSQKAEKSKTEINGFQLSFKSLKNKLMKK